MLRMNEFHAEEMHFKALLMFCPKTYIKLKEPKRKKERENVIQHSWGGTSSCFCISNILMNQLNKKKVELNMWADSSLFVEALQADVLTVRGLKKNQLPGFHVKQWNL